MEREGEREGGREGNFRGTQEKILELMKAVDEYIPLPPRDLDKPFLMPVRGRPGGREGGRERV